jgi:DNA polymerase
MTPAEYVMDPRFICNGASVKLDDRPTRWLDPEQLPQLFSALPANSILISHNMLFDGLIASWIYGWSPRLYVDTMGLARATMTRLQRYSLAALSKRLNLPLKDETILPRVKGMDLPSIRAAGFYKLYTEYAISDSDNCRGIFDKLIDGFPASELVIMDMVLRCAIEPSFAIDRNLLYEHRTIVAADKQTLLNAANLADRAGLMSQDQFAGLLRQFGVIPPTKISLKTGKPAYAFAKTDGPFMALLEHESPQVQALVAARLGLRSTLEQTRTEKFIDISIKCEHMPIPLRFSGAHTHRLSGDWGINMQNLPRGGRLRRALIAPEGCTVLAGDASQIEARMAAWLANCDTMLESFRKGVDVYAEFAGRVFGIASLTSESHPKERFIGKTAVLGLGYGLGHVKFADRVTATSSTQLGYKVEMSESEARDIVYGYRRTYWQIPVLWEALGGVGLAAMLGEAPATQIGPLEFSPSRIRLPNGLSLWYPGMARNSTTGEAEFFNPHFQGMEKLYGGKILENTIQALARIVIMDASLRILKLTGLRFVMQVHDELVYIVPDADVASMKQIIRDEMRRPPSWANTLPLDAKVGAGKTYGDAK